MTQQYDYESLGADKFQQLCQALLVKLHPNVQCFPVGMPDGGRDASTPSAKVSDGIVYQVKFRQPTPNRLATPDEVCEWLEKHLKGEIQKVETLASRGAQKYVVMTNAQCSSHLDVGTRDRMQSWLDQQVSIPAQVWWRDDLDRRLDGETDIKRTFGLLRDIAGLAEMLGIVSPATNQHEIIRAARSDRRISALLKYLHQQYERDRIVKFKQAELKPELLDVFVDVPMVPFDTYDNSLLTDMWPLDSSSGTALERWEGLISEKAKTTFAQSRRSGGAPTAGFLLRRHPATRRSAHKYVLEGAPGQGKSTVSQYVCQVHRARLLGLDEEIERFQLDHQSSPILLPFHVDLRDLSTWLRREDPFDITNNGEPAQWDSSLESFLAAQVRHESGGMGFDVSDLDAVTSATPVVVMLDGLDEVPDLNDRKSVVHAVNEGVTRIAFSSPFLLAVVTSRPSAFSRTPGFSKKDYTYLQMADLPLSLVLDYTDGWLRSRDVPHKEAFEIRKVLGDKLGQPHIADLARNPMQLAILLWLVHRKGLSLPDKRTALYGAYMDTFLDREAEKSQIVRDERDLILELHGYIAWHLHCQAEVGKSRGSIAETKLKGLLKRYLTGENYETDLVDQLFTGMTQRVMVLTSRVQNTFEFEVQPLREYFAARYLYSTAKVSPPGAERSGTRSDRFEALLRNPYWWNVTRFYAGFSDKGELANVVDLLDDLFNDGDFALISYPSEVASTLLRDQVFAQRPKSAAKALDLVTSERGLKLLSLSATADAESMVFSEGYGSYDIVSKLEQRIEKSVISGSPDYYAAGLLAVNRDRRINLNWWFDKWQGTANTFRKDAWFKLLPALRVLPMADRQHLKLLCSQAPRNHLVWQYLIDGGIPFVPEKGTVESLSLNAALGSGLLRVPPAYHRPFTTVYQAAAYALSSDYLGRRVSEYYFPEESDFLVAVANMGRAEADSQGLAIQILQAMNDFMKTSKVGNDIDLWVSCHEALVKAFGGETRATQCFALIGGEVRSGSVSRARAGDLFDTAISPVLRARYARQRRNDVAWWREQVRGVTTVNDAWFILGAMQNWAPREVFWESTKLLNEWVKQFAVEDIDLFLRRLFFSDSARRDGEEERETFSAVRGLSHQALYLCSLNLDVGPASEVLAAAMRKANDRHFAGFYASRGVDYLLARGMDKVVENLDLLRDLEKASSKTFLPSRHLVSPPRKMSQSTAREMLSGSDWIPLGLLRRANQLLTNQISRKALPLEAVAKRDDWFTE
ncbi:hypothetical protein ABT052_02335 [Streptomyces sp. NPDC002766]|uniref:NACHT domain-containing protein n=1 Tax=Streptomyces sp. NPDC002766 TaxID=3154429 RepID=UPI00332673BB